MIYRKENIEKAAKKAEAEKQKEEKKKVYVLCLLSRLERVELNCVFCRYSTPLPASLFLSHNTALGPPYRVLIDTNFINFSIQNKIELVQGMMDCLLAKCIPTVTDCVLAELEKLGPKYRLALK
jgi:U3 small nucleolar RNA-associated protein 24